MVENIEVLLQALKEGDEARRIEAAQTLAQLGTSSKEIVRALECAVVSDPSQAVQQAALAALATPIHRHIHRQLVFTPFERHAILLHVDSWVADGLITPQIAALLKGRYALLEEPPRPQKRETAPRLQTPEAVVSSKEPEVMVRPQKPEVATPREPATPKEPIRKKEELFEGEIAAEGDAVLDLPPLEKQKFSLVGTFTSETTIKIALYLGAFLIVAAAVIFAGLVEPARFPMLSP